jgi:hypothetical protein
VPKNPVYFSERAVLDPSEGRLERLAVAVAEAPAAATVSLRRSFDTIAWPALDTGRISMEGRN